jgi:hypothetical protein
MASGFNDLRTQVTDFRGWRAEHPSAVSLYLDGDADLADFAAFVTSPDHPMEGLLKLKMEYPAQAHAPHGVVPATYGASLAAAVGGISTLQELHLPFAGLDDVHGAALAAALPPNLTFLDLTHNLMGPAGAAALAAALPGLPQLTTLRLSGNPLEAAGVAALAPALPATLRVLELGCPMGDAGAAALTAVLPRLHGLTCLDVSTADMTATGLRALLPSLPGILRELNLSRNRFGPAGAEAIAAAFPRIRGLQLLSLKACALGDEGMHALAPALPPELTELRLQDNGINVDGARALVAVLPTLPKFRRLGFLGGNKGVLGIIEALRAALPGKTISMQREDEESYTDGTLEIYPSKRKRSSRRTNRRCSSRRSSGRSSGRSSRRSRK